MIALLSGGTFAMAFTLFLTPLFIKLFRRLGWGQLIRVDGPQSHHTKHGTATMGGIVFITASVLGYFFGHLVTPGVPLSASGLLVLLMMVGMGIVGFIDDFAKTRKQQSLGLGGWAKIAGQVIVGTIFAILAIQFPDPTTGLTPASMAVSILRDLPWLNFAAFGVVGVILYAIWVNLIMVAATNGVNVTDGLDGLAAGAAVMSIAAFLFIALIQFNQACHNLSTGDPFAYKCFAARDPLDLAIVAACIAGSLIGFLWWNTSPAQIFMGDTGSLGLGGALAALAIMTRTELLLLVAGGLFCIETGSVILQRVYFKLTHGKRIILMSPVHHHFELKGWAEVTIVFRFWLIAGFFAIVTISLFYLGWSTS